MYLPKHFSTEENARVKKLIEQNPFATILSFPKESKPFINHLPVIFSAKAGEEEIIIGHMAKRNPQWMHFKKNSECTILIHGAHTYITPKWYKSGRDVPTWNYAVAHLHGKIELMESFSEQIDTLKQLTTFFEKTSPDPWEFELPQDLLDEAALTSAIISFRFKIENIEAKFKLSQNRGLADRTGMIDGLSERPDEMSKMVRDMMLENE